MLTEPKKSILPVIFEQCLVRPSWPDPAPAPADAVMRLI